MDKNSSLVFLKKILTNVEIGFLSTINNENDTAETRAVSNLRKPKNYPKLIHYFEENPKDIIIITRNNSEKIKQIKDNNKASIYYYDDDTLDGITVFGKLSIIEDNNLRNLLWNNISLNSINEFVILKFKMESFKYYDKDLNLIKNNL